MAGKSISFKLANGDGSFTLNEDQIAYLTSDTLGQVLVYEDGGEGLKKHIQISDTTASVVALSNVLVGIKDNDAGDLIYINYERIVDMFQNSDSQAVIYMDDGGQDNHRIVSSRTLIAVREAIATKAGETAHQFDDVNATNNTITLVAGAGDLTGTFTAGETFATFGTANNNHDRVYTVTSSAFTASRTVITVTEGINTGDGDTGLVVI